MLGRLQVSDTKNKVFHLICLENFHNVPIFRKMFSKKLVEGGGQGKAQAIIARSLVSQ